MVLEITPAVSDCGAVRNTSLLAAPGTTVSVPESVEVRAPEVT